MFYTKTPQFTTLQTQSFLKSIFDYSFFFHFFIWIYDPDLNFGNVLPPLFQCTLIFVGNDLFHPRRPHIAWTNPRGRERTDVAMTDQWLLIIQPNDVETPSIPRDPFVNRDLFRLGPDMWIHHCFEWVAITYPCPNLKGCLISPPLKLRHGWVITNHCFTLLFLSMP